MLRFHRLAYFLLGLLGLATSVWRAGPFLNAFERERLLTYTTASDIYESIGENGLLHEELKVATFGLGSTFGLLLKNRFKEAFPYLLSANVDNYAHHR